ncbi:MULTISPECIES: hypothetical protein [unclassified Duganella]|uniref:hypothetical protein n=1 Tax=unclassified Duganella TaxID=2636909 RepID=UPI000887CC04|nr:MULTISPECIES: hypothetical protein [unclassified Duganella]SDF79642.1 hypothetical protein SAMN05216320_1011351 [Duganella sp. OV458]SDI49482.1 hypothetical protein SAMN05428973_10164 [Duganella sp. OV510]
MSNQNISALLICASLLILFFGQMHLRTRGRLQRQQAAAAALIYPAHEQRDDDGWWWHPELPNFEEDHQAYAAWMLAQGLEYKFDSLESEADTNPAYIAYYEHEAGHVRDWFCEPPAGEGWFTLSIHDTEDGPQWVWARRVGTEVLMARIQGEALAYHERFYGQPLPSGQRYSGSQFKPNGEPYLLRSNGVRSICCDGED